MESTHIYDCTACEAALCDYVDGALSETARAGVDLHLAQCPACAAFLRDIREGMGLLAEAPSAEPSPILVNKILFQIPAKPNGLSGWLGRLFEPVLQPRVVMGAMMTVLSGDDDALRGSSDAGPFGVRPRSGEGVGLVRRPHAPDLGPDGEGLRKHAGGVRGANPGSRMAATPGRARRGGRRDRGAEGDEDAEAAGNQAGQPGFAAALEVVGGPK